MIRLLAKIFIPIIIGTGLTLLISCAPQEFVVQHSDKGKFSQYYKHLGVYCDRTDVHLHAWESDSVSIAITMQRALTNNYSFLVDSIKDSLLLLGKYGVAPNAQAGEVMPVADIHIPVHTDIKVRTSGSVIVDSLDGPMNVLATDTIIYTCLFFTTPVTLVSSGGTVKIELPSNFAGNVDFECGSASEIHFKSPYFKGNNQKTAVQGAIGKGGALLKVKGKKGIDVSFY